MANEVAKVLEHIVTVAKGAAAQVGVSFGTVIGRNPDGTINVDPGNGGCVRMIASANVRKGDRVPLGTEAAPGTVTSLEATYTEIEPPVDGCPVDPRLPPPVTQPPATEAALTIRWGIQNNVVTWADRNTITPVSGSYGTTTIANMNATATHLGSDPFRRCRRGWAEFDTSGVLPEGAVLTGAKFQWSVSSGAPPFSVADHDVIFVPGTNPDFTLFDPGATLLNDILIDVELARFRILDIVTGGTLNEVALDIEAFDPYFSRTGRTKIAVVTQYDVEGTDPPFNAGNPADEVKFNDVTHPNPFLVVSYSLPVPL